MSEEYFFFIAKQWGKKFLSRSVINTELVLMIIFFSGKFKKAILNQKGIWEVSATD